MAITHKCDRCGIITDEVYVFQEVVYEKHKKLSYELCKNCAEKIKKWLSDPNIEMAYQSKPVVPCDDSVLKPKEETSETKLSCYDKWRLHSQMQANCSQTIGRCLCGLQE